MNGCFAVNAIFTKWSFFPPFSCFCKLLAFYVPLQISNKIMMMVITVCSYNFIGKRRARRRRENIQMASLKFHPHLPLRRQRHRSYFHLPVSIEHSCIYFLLLEIMRSRLMTTHAENEQFLRCQATIKIDFLCLAMMIIAKKGWILSPNCDKGKKLLHF